MNERQWNIAYFPDEPDYGYAESIQYESGPLPGLPDTWFSFTREEWMNQGGE